MSNSLLVNMKNLVSIDYTYAGIIGLFINYKNQTMISNLIPVYNGCIEKEAWYVFVNPLTMYKVFIDY